MHADPILFTLFLIFTGAALLATVGLFARQSLLVIYILLGVLLGPWGAAWVNDPQLVQNISQVGVIFLLFLLGLNLHPQRLFGMLRKALTVTLASSVVFAGAGAGIALLFGFSGGDALVVGAAAMFSSTIIGLKLLPTTELHHRHTGEVIISILLLQDLIAIIILLVIQAQTQSAELSAGVGQLFLGLPALMALAFVGARYLLVPLFSRFDTIVEYVFLLALGWCLGVAQLGSTLGLSHEIGAFIGGVALASSPIATFIAERLKPLRDFFLVMFFFSLGATFDMGAARAVLGPALLLIALLLVLKPLVFDLLLRWAGEERGLAREVGVRLGQISEFSLFIAMLATQTGVLSERAGYTVQLATLLGFIASSYIVMLKFRTPIAVSPRLRQD